jgi:5-formyltetrahydrofolate cyclo-ligase
VAGVPAGQGGYGRAMEMTEAQKVALRDQLTTTRRRRRLVEVRSDADAIAGHLLATPEVRRAATVAAYVSIGQEPGTGPLIEQLHAMGRRVILPVLLPDNDLDWATYTGPSGLVPARRGLLEPVSPPLGVDAVATADVVLCPGLAVARDGMRLGRGGGSYDRALGRVPVGTFVCVLLYDGELLDTVPTDAHDRPVTAVVTPGGVTRLPAARG